MLIVNSVFCYLPSGVTGVVVFCCFYTSAPRFNKLCIQRWSSAYLSWLVFIWVAVPSRWPRTSLTILLWDKQGIVAQRTASHWLFSHFSNHSVCKPQRWLFVKNLAFFSPLKYSHQPVWNKHPFHTQNHLNGFSIVIPWTSASSCCSMHVRLRFIHFQYSMKLHFIEMSHLSH